MNKRQQSPDENGYDDRGYARQITIWRLNKDGKLEIAGHVEGQQPDSDDPPTFTDVTDDQ